MTMRNALVIPLSTMLLALTAFAQQPVEMVAVAAKPVDRKSLLPGEFQPYQEVEIHAKISGFVERVLVDRGSAVKKGQLLAALDAPELKTQRAEAEARVQAVEAQRAEAQARLVSEQGTYDHLKAASATPGVIAGNDLVTAEKRVDAARAQVGAVEASIRAAQSAVKVIGDMQQYLELTAPFDGVITERNISPGALVGPAGKSLFHLEQNSRLRLIVAVPEPDVSGIAAGAHVTFTVPAFPGVTFNGTIARVAHSMDVKTRSMPVELDVNNGQRQLAPGMYATVNWPVKRAGAALVVPASAVAGNTERTFVIRNRNGVAEWVSVSKGVAMGADMIEVIGPLQPGDMVVKRASDEIREGTKLK
ncbi:MAG: efflux transporter, family, subunit [Candidatus Solibacter sp.]|jgi:membrane fusion protein (multidrug efflux system)|nr:efflux transporter, family, subunit [Candidatus Solibacter sp.]